jgi:hypothetical protein
VFEDVAVIDEVAHFVEWDRNGHEGRFAGTGDPGTHSTVANIPSTAPSGMVLQLFVSEPFNDTIAVVNLGITGPASPANNQVFQAGKVTRISASQLNMPVDLAPVVIDKDDPMWASNTTLDDGSDFYVANRGNNTIVRMHQDGSVIAVRRVSVDNRPLDNASLNGIATSPDGTTIYVTFTAF